MKPIVSIVIVNYNGYEWLKLCLPSLINTNYPAYEIILVDNGSVDQSINYVKNNWQNSVNLIQLSSNFGFAEGCNIGVRQANGDVIAFLNNDMEVDSNWLRAAVESLLSDKRVAVVQPKIMQFNSREKIDCAGLSVDRFGLCVQIGHGEVDNGQYNQLTEIWSSGGAMVLWKEILMKVGLFDDTFFMYYEDVDLCWRIKLAGFRILLAPSSMVYHAGSATANTIPSEFIVFHSMKNHISSWLKNFSLATLILNFPVSMFVIVASLLLEIKNRHFSLFVARIKSIIWVVRNIGRIRKERHKVQHSIRKKGLTDSDIFFVGNNMRRTSNLVYHRRTTT
jgi:GT2 family glycosyltransferase